MSSSQKSPIIPSRITLCFFSLYICNVVCFFSKQARFLIHFTDIEMRLFEGLVVEISDVIDPPRQSLLEPEVGEPPLALGWASTPSMLYICVSLCGSGGTAWGFSWGQLLPTKAWERPRE